MNKRLVVLFADVGGSTTLYQEKGDANAHKLITDCLRALEVMVATYRGKLLRTVGDAILCSFDSVDDACQLAIEVQRHYQSEFLSLRIGFHEGEVIPDRGDVYGNAVNIAARVASFANVGEIFTTQNSVEKLSQMFKESAQYLDEIEFKGIADPMSVYRIDWSESDADVTKIAQFGRSRSFSKHGIFRLTMEFNEIRIELDSNNPKLTFGRGQHNDIVVNHESASRQHATIVLRQSKFVLTDESTNGTYICFNNLARTEFVRRSSIVLDAMGEIGAGWDPQLEDAPSLRFSISSSEPKL